MNFYPKHNRMVRVSLVMLGIVFVFSLTMFTLSLLSGQLNSGTPSENTPELQRSYPEENTPDDITAQQQEEEEPLQDLPLAEQLPKQHMIDVLMIKQLPELYNGCEVTSLAMLAAYLNLPYDKLELAALLSKDPTPVQRDKNGKITFWGNPDVGFVGDITGKQIGYAVNNGPIEQLLEEIYGPGRTENLTGLDFKDLQRAVSDDRPVIIWTTANFEPTNQWLEWSSHNGTTVKATFQIHAVLLVGYDDNHVYVNNPLSGTAAENIAIESFIKSWEQLGKQAVTFKR